jgi:tripartite-type tricarboxylate transporter receptor subunit TctC
MKRMLYFLLVSTFVAVYAFAPAPTIAGPPYYNGKTIELIADSKAGGGTDRTARINSIFIKKHVPGNPRVIVRNISGGGGMIAQNYFYNRAKRDGTALLQSHLDLLKLRPVASGLDPKMIKFNVRELRAIGSLHRGGNVIFMRPEAAKRLTDPTAEPVRVAGTEGRRTGQSMYIWGKEFFGFNVRFVLGFGGTSDLVPSLERGEVDAFATADRTELEQFRAKGWVFLYQNGSRVKGKWLPRPDFPDVPLFPVALGEKVSGIPWRAYIAWNAPSLVEKWISAPPGTPDHVVKILRDAYSQWVEDPEYKKLLKKMVSPVTTTMVGEEVEEVIREVSDAPPDVFEYQNELMRRAGIPVK